MAEHTLRPDQIHHKWDNSLPPAIEIEPGDIRLHQGLMVYYFHTN